MAYMRDRTGRRLDTFPVAGLADRSAPVNLAMLGDSLAGYGEGIATYIEIMSKQKFRFADPDGGGKRTYSYPGQTSAVVLTHVDDVTGLATRPDACIIQVGTNDAIASTPTATTIANIEAICAAMEDAGIRPIMTTIPPLGGPFQHSARNAPGRALNIALRRSAQRNHRFMVDPYLPLVDATTGRYLSAYDTGDNVHPNATGLAVWAQEIITALGGIGGNDYTLLERVNDSNSLMGAVRIATGGGNFGGSNNAGFGVELGVTTAPTGHTPSLVASDVSGCNWQRITVSGASQALTYYQATAATVAPGDLIRAAARIRIGQEITGATRFQVYIRTYQSGGSDLGNFQLTGPLGLSRPITDGIAMTTFVVPALANRIQLIAIIPAVNGTYDLAQPTIQNLTALGVA